jgi:hypothetical protein
LGGGEQKQLHPLEKIFLVAGAECDPGAGVRVSCVEANTEIRCCFHGRTSIATLSSETQGSLG